MRDPFKDSGSADDWFNNLWTADVDMNTAMYGNTGTDMLYKSLIPKSPELTDVIAVYPKSSTILILVFRKSKYLWYNGLALPIGRIGQR